MIFYPRKCEAALTFKPLKVQSIILTEQKRKNQIIISKDEKKSDKKHPFMIFKKLTQNYG